MSLDANHYKKHSKQQYDRSRPILNGCVLSKKAKILDVGCGDGKITFEIASKVPDGYVVGIDSCQNMIHLASNTFKLKNLKFKCVGVEDFETQEKFDNIFCLSCLLWVRKPKDALIKLARSLSEEGIIYILTYLKDSRYVDLLEKTLEDFPEYKHLSASHTMLSDKEHFDILTKCGLEVEVFEVANCSTSYSSKEELKNYLKGWLTCYVPIPSSIQELFLNKAVENSQSFSTSRNLDQIEIPYKSLTIRAKKRSDIR